MVLAATALVAGIFLIADVGTPVRPIVTLWFLLICPGMAFVRLLRLEDRLAEVTLAIAVSIALDTVVAAGMVYAKVWSPVLGLLVLAGLTLVGTALQVLDRRTAMVGLVRGCRQLGFGLRRVVATAKLHALLGLQWVIGALRLGPVARRVLWWLGGQRRRSRAVGDLLPVVRARVSEQPDLPPPADWTVYRSIPTVTDRLVVLIGPRQQRPVAVVKFEQLDHRQNGLPDETAVLRALQADPRLGDWRRLLPQVLAEGEVGGQVYRAERLLPGVPGSRLLAKPAKPLRLQATAAAAIGELHRRTASPTRFDAKMLEQWVDEPVRGLLCLSAARTGWDRHRPAIERLRTELGQALLGRTLAVSWVHGDYWPANVLVSDDGATVTGIIDWDLAQPDGLPLLDLVHLFLSVRMIMRRQELGVVVRSLLNGAEWTPHERELLAAAWAALPGERIRTREMMLLSWLQHIDATRTKASRFGGPLLWESRNIELVLQAL